MKSSILRSTMQILDNHLFKTRVVTNIAIRLHVSVT